MASQQQPLQLTDVAHGEQKGWRRHQELVDSLPYIDSMSQAEKAAVDALIEEEVRRPSPQPRAGLAAACRRRSPPPARGVLPRFDQPCCAACVPADAQQQQEAGRLPG